jgi:membrane-bound metal-dependent hydrolase YbcI (DUF457 family)
MDTITHGIVGSLIGKGYFSERHGRVAVFAATVGAMFPDADVVEEIFSRDPLAVIRYHRGITHAWFGMPFFAAALAWLTRWLARKFGYESPSFGVLWIIYVVAIASHIALDGMTSFGTRMWDPFSQTRVAWDMLFIVDFTFTGIALLPQMVAWVYRDSSRTTLRASIAWVICACATGIVWLLARAVGFPFHAWIVALAAAIFAAAFFGPGVARQWKTLRRTQWCRAGVYVLIGYIAATFYAHHVALARVSDFAAANHVAVDRMGALPLPPSLVEWGGVIRTPDGVYASRFDLRDTSAPKFSFTADSPLDSFVARALKLPEVRLYWGFARFPVIRVSSDEDHHIVDFFDQRFITRRRSDQPAPFTYRVVFDASGDVVEEGWQSNGLLMRRTKKMASPRAGDP